MRFVDGMTPDVAAKFGKEAITWNHSLHQSPLFEDKALAKLIDIHPRDHADFCTMNEGADDMASWRGGDPGSHTGEELLEAVRQGRLWINLRKTFNMHDEYVELLNGIQTQLKQACTGFRPTSMMGGLLISSPTAGVPYHIDRSDVILWHIRGHKRVWVYPIDEETLPETEVEEILLHDHNDDVPYRAEFDRKATVIDMEPGMVASWSLHGPHRVVNQGDLNVSLTMEWSPLSTIIQNGAHITNGILRRRLGHTPQIEQQGPATRLARFAASRVLRKMKLVKAKSATEQGYQFDVALDGKTGVSEYS